MAAQTESQTMSTDEVRQRFAENLRRLRERSGISQENLARICDLHRTEVSLLERCLRSPRLDTLIILAEGLKLSSLAELVEGIE
ncbi:MAG TPA: helix-turn-helix transcriptional regulator [Solirubrobacteraceae bacterium]|jgi:transcriptional regulator with XRE-family HTH domain